MNVKINPLTEAEKQALILKEVVESQSYKDTIGAWLLEERGFAIQKMAEATDPHEVHRAQGSFAFIQALLQRIEASLTRAKAQKKKRVQILTKE